MITQDRKVPQGARFESLQDRSRLFDHRAGRVIDISCEEESVSFEGIQVIHHVSEFVWAEKHAKMGICRMDQGNRSFQTLEQIVSKLMLFDYRRAVSIRDPLDPDTCGNR